jgi:hypothetical protein
LSGFGTDVLVGSIVGSAGGTEVFVGTINVSVGATAIKVGKGVGVSDAAGIGWPGKGGKINRLKAMPIKIKPIPPERKRAHLPTAGIFTADISKPPPKRPIKKNMAPITSKVPSFVCGMLPSWWSGDAVNCSTFASRFQLLFIQ